MRKEWKNTIYLTSDISLNLIPKIINGEKRFIIKYKNGYKYYSLIEVKDGIKLRKD